MIISKKKYQEDIRKAVKEAVNRVEHEEWIRSRIDGIERNTEERIDGVMRHVLRLEDRLEALDHSKERKLRGWAMTDVFCDNTDCRWHQEGCCGRGVINICDGECEGFEDYHDDIEWQTPYWKRMGSFGKQYKVKFFGKRIERDGIVFFVDTNSVHADCTEEISGLNAGHLCDLDEDRIEKVKKWFAADHQDLPPLESLPTAVYKNGKLIPVEKQKEDKD